ncbi:enoyl-CoA hydratase [Candidatus Bathyarchaeota archaeon]|nr:enoyl-CoA hydratase [Candidatus Bathyarchaeota archaeon]MBS7630310.1 enoyl-CoA hydratase [Candidatus Bathyarchaeota archaeon]
MITRIEDSVYWIILNRPDKLNSINPEMLEMLERALDKVEGDSEIRCVVITGAGDRAFSAGADISFFRNLSPEEAEKVISSKGHHAFLRIMNSNKPVIAAVNGLALGGGCELSLMCDFRIASDKARFGQTEVNLGLIPGWGATRILPKIVGPSHAKWMMMTGCILSAEEALKIGLVNRVVQSDQFSEEIKRFAISLAKGPNVALAEIKRLINSSIVDESDLASEAKSFGRIFETEDFKEGLTAFFEKRKPCFKGS